MATTPNKKTQISANDIKHPDQITHVRKRVGMYLGSNSDEGMTTALREFADNAIDEALAGYGDEAIVRFYDDGSAEVEDHGRGLPVDKNSEGINGIILTLGTIGSGGKFNSSNYEISGGLNGVGASAAVATSSRADVTVYNKGKRYVLSFKEGRPGFFAKPNDPTSTFTPDIEIREEKDTRSAAEKKAVPTGTTVRFWPDYTVFIPGSKFLVDDIRFRLKSTAFLVNGLSITIEDLRDPANPVVDVYRFDGGLTDMLPTLTSHEFVVKPIHLQAQSEFSEVTNVLGEDNRTAQQEVKRPVAMDVSFGFVNTEDTILRSYVNIINTKNGGTHEGGLWRALSRVLINYIKDTKGFLKAKEEPPILEDVKDGFVGVISIKFPEPIFTGQEKSTLDSKQITTVVSQAVGKELQAWLDNKKNAVQAKLLAQKIVEASKIRLAAKQQKDTQRKQSALESSSAMPAKLAACSSKDSNITELQICEGDSALGGLKLSRSATFQAIYPLKGKPLNVFNLALGKVLANQEWADLIQIIGAGVGRSFDLEAMRYKRIILLADADPDGNHISVLLTSFFWKYMRPLIEDGRLYIALPPLFSITTNGKNKERFYALNKEELDVLVKKLASQGKKYDKIQRHKGLGEYSPEILAEVVMNPESRVLRQVTGKDVEEIERVLELTMGNNALARRNWIIENRALIGDEELDIA